jgi:uncharacterized protein (TIGR02117 family)
MFRFSLSSLLLHLAVALLLLIGLLGLYVVVVFVCAHISIPATTAPSNEVTIFIKTNGVHTDIVVPVKTEIMDWSKVVKYEHTLSRDTTPQYLAFGWGDKGFYLETPTWDDLKISTAFNAAFGWGSAAMHTTFYHGMTESASCKKITISKRAYQQLVRYLQSGFLRTRAGAFLHIDAQSSYAREALDEGRALVYRYGRHDAFYEGVGSYSMYHTCNTWANNALKACEQKACLWTPFDFGIFWQYE